MVHCRAPDFAAQLKVMGRDKPQGLGKVADIPVASRAKRAGTIRPPGMKDGEKPRFFVQWLGCSRHVVSIDRQAWP